MSSPQSDLNLPYNFVRACIEATRFGSSADEIAGCLKVDIKFVHLALCNANSEGLLRRLDNLRPYEADHKPYVPPSSSELDRAVYDGGSFAEA
jgi:hypothetical protein